MEITEREEGIREVIDSMESLAAFLIIAAFSILRSYNFTASAEEIFTQIIMASPKI